MKISAKTRSLIRQSLCEDIGRGDITSKLFIPIKVQAKAWIQAKASGILCGGEVVREVFSSVNRRLTFKHLVPEGSRVSKGERAFQVIGDASSILKGERVALNFLGRLSGIATLTNQYVREIHGTQAQIYDTRKTTPLWRELEKNAVRIGGGKNHRFGLWDEALLKDNHWKILISFGAKLGRPSRTKIPIEIEITNLKQLNRLLDGNFIPDRILLDNFSVSELRKAVRIAKRKKPSIILEASGGIHLGNVRKMARTGVDRISVGALTHSAPVLDFSLELSQVIKR